jgi:Ras-related protein Rab-8A
VRTWHSNVEQHATEGVNKILIGNKCDWEESKKVCFRAQRFVMNQSADAVYLAKVVSNQQARELAEELGIPYLETSAKSSINVDEAFFTLAR